MGYYVVSAGGNLYKLTTAGVATQLSLPTNTEIDSARVMRMAVLGRNVFCANAGSRGIQIDADFNCYAFGLQPPMSAPTLAAGGAGGLTGAYRVAYTHKIKDENGDLISESPMSPTSAQQSVSSQLLTANFEVSQDSGITHRGLYRTVASGSVLFPWIDIEGNTLTSYSDDLSDTLLANIAAPTELGAPPGTVPGTRLTLIVEWKGRLWGVGNIDVDVLRFSGAGLGYAWPADYALDIAPVGADIYGITGLIRRRDELGIARRNILWKIVGEDPDSFEPIKVIEGKGCYAPDSVCVIRDVGYFLGEDGVYAWGTEGVKSVSDEKVRNWFASDDYFNRSLYPSAFAKYNSKYHTYELHLAAAGSSNIDRWVSFDIATGSWFGPHRTSGFTPTYAGEIVDSNNLIVPVILASDGKVYMQNQSGFQDPGSSAIAIDAISKRHSGDTPDIAKLWKRLAVLTKKQSTAGNLAIVAAAGTLEATTTKTFNPAQTKSRNDLDIIGPGEHLQLQFTESTLAQGFEIYGYEVPYHELGRR